MKRIVILIVMLITLCALAYAEEATVTSSSTVSGEINSGTIEIDSNTDPDTIPDNSQPDENGQLIPKSGDEEPIQDLPSEDTNIDIEEPVNPYIEENEEFIARLWDEISFIVDDKDMFITNNDFLLDITDDGIISSE